MHDPDLPLLTLDALARAAWRMLWIDALPVPLGMDLGAVTGSGRMAPWLQEAMGPEGADAVVASGRGGWELSVLMGRDRCIVPGRPTIGFDAADADLLLLVDGVCSAARMADFCFMIEVMRVATPETLPLLMRMSDEVSRADASRRTRRLVSVGDTRRLAFRVVAEVARLRGITLTSLPVTVDLAGGAEAATVVSVERSRSGEAVIQGIGMTRFTFAADDGHRWTWSDRSLTRDWDDSVGGRVELLTAGVAPGSRGYVSQVRPARPRAGQGTMAA